MSISVHYSRSNTGHSKIWRANEFGHRQYARIVKLQDPEVDVRIGPGFGGGLGVGTLIDIHTSLQDPKKIDPRLLDWVKKEMNWKVHCTSR